MHKGNYKNIFGVLLVSIGFIFLLLSVFTVNKVNKLGKMYKDLLDTTPISASMMESTINIISNNLAEIENRMAINQNDFVRLGKISMENIADVKSRLMYIDMRILELDTSIRVKEFIKNSTEVISLIITDAEQLNDRDLMITYRTLTGIDTMQIVVDVNKTVFYIFDPYNGNFRFSDVSMFNERLKGNVCFESKLYISKEDEKMIIEVYHP